MTPKAKRTSIRTVRMAFIRANENEHQPKVKVASVFDSLSLHEGGHIPLPRSFSPLLLKEAKMFVFTEKGRKEGEGEPEESQIRKQAP